MTTQDPVRFAGVLARFERQVVLVREEYISWGGAYWNIPSGRLEGTRPLLRAPAGSWQRRQDWSFRSLGLFSRARLPLRVRTQVSQAWNFTVDVDDPALRVSDPDGLIQDARWFSAEEAVRLLVALPYRPLSEPAVAILTGKVSVGTHWEYSDPTGDPIIAVQER